MNSDNTLIQKELNWEPSISLVEGLERTYAWIYDQIVSGRTSHLV
jgi:nucleoside-diphosphate-sugar epimerase